ncbi:MAG: 30S ribosome-binding factor RbfA [Planctomycetaceae bacterium]|nr:MAG: 30S ribosome-binding factor RbfA [Planctomycetaceae bacterium]
MTRRLERINALIRNTIGELLLAKISDPRIDPARTSVTHVEIADDLESAKVFVSVMGSPAQQKLAVSALQHAAGHIQELMMRQIQLRSTPRLTFVLDEQFKKTLEVLRSIQEAAEETRQRDLLKQESQTVELPEKDSNQ